MRSVATNLTLSWWVFGAIVAGLVLVALALGLARRRVTVRLAGSAAGPGVRASRGPCGEALPLYLRARMKRLSWGRGASETALHLYAVADIHLHLVRYGPTQELTSREVKNGKGGTRTVSVSGVAIDKWEPVPFEDMEVWTTVPAAPGKYLAWATSFGHGGAGASGVSRFVFTVRGGRFTVRKVSYLGTWRLRVLRWFASPNPYDLPRFPSLQRARW
jgi:hypothetical protein